MGTTDQNRRYYERGGKRRIQEANQRYRNRNREYVRALKHEQPCSDCGTVFPHWVLDYDHRDSASKESDVSTYARGGVSIDKLQREIDKCDLVCANCHRHRTWTRSHCD